MPWLNIERTSQTVNGAHIVAIVTGIGARNRRRGQVVPLRYRCLIDDKGDAVSFTWRDLLPERNDYLPPAMLLHGTAYYEPRHELPPGAELRVQLFDQAANPPALLTELVVRSSWVEPIPYALRLPHDMKLRTASSSSRRACRWGRRCSIASSNRRRSPPTSCRARSTSH